MIAPTPPPSPDNDYGRIIELLVYTGCRRDEIGGPQWSEVGLEAD